MIESHVPPKPEWLRVRVPAAEDRDEVFRLMETLSLHTVCEEANCPNLAECFGRGTATFMILGKQCTRHCTFCNVSHQTPTPVDPNEAEHVAEAVKKLRLRHVVVTSVTRDDMPDGGAGQFARIIAAIRTMNPGTTVEVLIPDFRGDRAALETVLEARPDILAHNVETVPSLYPAVRPMADYRQSLALLQHAAQWGDGTGFKSSYVKSGIMLGLGETEREVTRVLEDLRAVGCTHLSMGQYLAPSGRHHPVAAYVTPEMFAEWKKTALSLGFLHVASGPLVRSSYHAEEGLPARQDGNMRHAEEGLPAR